MNAEMEQLRADPALQKDYEAWVNSPMTRFVIRCLEQLNRPVMPNTTEPTVLAACHSTQCGVFNTIAQMQGLTKISAREDTPEPDYGFREILKTQGRELNEKEN